MATKLKPSLGPAALLFFCVSLIVGSGWLFAPFYALKLAGPAAIFAWLLGAVMMLVIALPFAELAVRLPAAGGLVRYSAIAFGYPSAFIISWVSWLSFVFVAPIEVQAAIEYSSHFFPHLIYIDHGADALSGLGYLVATVLMALFVIVNLFGIRLAARVSGFFAVWKLIVPVIAIIVLFNDHFHLANFSKYGGMAPFGLSGILAAVSSGGVIFAYVGFRAVIEVSSEAENPKRAIPFAIFGSLLICVVLYTSLQIAFLGALPHVVANQGWKNLHIVGNSGGPLMNLATSLGIIWLAVLLYVDSIASPAGSGLVATTSTARINYAMSRLGYMPHFMGKINYFGVPFMTLIVNFIVGMLIFLPFHGWQVMVSELVSISVLAYSVGAINMQVFRLYAGTEGLSLKLPCGLLISLLAFYCASLIIYWTGWNTLWHLAILLLIGLAVLLIQIVAQGKKIGWPQWQASLWLWCYVPGLLVLSWLGSFGGKHIISTQWSFLWLALLSLFCYIIAIAVKLPKAFFEERLQDFRQNAEEVTV